ncbi:hypothetical protein AgCh_007088 [Apium graveolens]
MLQRRHEKLRSAMEGNIVEDVNIDDDVNMVDALFRSSHQILILLEFLEIDLKEAELEAPGESLDIRKLSNFTKNLVNNEESAPRIPLLFTCSFQAYSRDLEAELHVLQEENARLQHALMWVDDGYLDMYDSVYPSPNIIEQLHLLDLIPRPYNASEEESLFVFPSEVRIEGLETLDYLDNLSDRKCFTEQGDAITFESEVDRAYLSTEDCIAVLDHGKKFEIKKGGLSFYRRFYCSPRSWKEV